jgi:methylornithine synthase
MGQKGVPLHLETVMTDDRKLSRMLSAILEGRRPDAGEIRCLLTLRDPRSVDRLFRAARQVRRRHFENRIFLYGFIYFSTHCRNNCRFCYYRKSNHRLVRYRRSDPQILAAAVRLAGAGVHLIDLTMGEDPLFFDGDGAAFERLEVLIGRVRAQTGLPVMISPGVIDRDIAAMLAAAGADWYACYQETHNRRLFATLRPGQDYDARRQARENARHAGLLVEDGILAGVGESRQDLADSIGAMGRMDADQVRVMSFVPRDEIPLVPPAPPDPLRELVTIAVMRLAFPDRLIPASLDIDGLAGLQQRLDAGANVITSLIPPDGGLAGVANSRLDIEEALRTPSAVRPVLARCGLETASAEAYRQWIERRQSVTGLREAAAIDIAPGED